MLMLVVDVLIYLCAIFDKNSNEIFFKVQNKNRKKKNKTIEFKNKTRITHEYAKLFELIVSACVCV